MICKECGIQLPDIAKFCYKCGKTVSAEDLQNDFDPFGTDDGFIPEKKVIKKEASVKESDKEEASKKEDNKEETSEEASKEETGKQDSNEEETEDLEMLIEATIESDATDSTDKEESDKEESDKEESDEKDSDEKDTDEADSDEEEAPANTGFKIMRNPDYVPPEVEEEKPFYEEHVNYEELREQRAAKMEKRMQIVSVIVGIAVLIGIGLFAFSKYANHKDYTEKYDAAQALYDAGDYEGAFAAFGELVEHKGADEEEMVCKQFDCLQAIGDEARARDFAYNACRKYSSDNIRKLLSAVSTSGTATKAPATIAPTVEPTTEPTIEPTIEPTVAPTIEPTVAPTEEPNNEPTETPEDEPETPVVDYTAYEDTFVELYTGMETLRNSATPIDALRVMITEEYAKVKASGKNIYYFDGKFATEVGTADNVLMVCPEGYAYFGSMTEGKASGAGVYMSANKSDKGIAYCYYRGLWENGVPNGAGIIEKIDDETGIKTVTTTKFVAGVYDGNVVVTNYRGNEELDKTTYSIVEGVPTPVQDEAGNNITVDGKPVIGYTVSSTGEQTEVTWDGTTKFVVEGYEYFVK